MKQVHVPGHPCPVCGGHVALTQGRGARCAGFSLDLVTYCTREQYAGDLPLEGTNPPSYKHRRFGACECGQSHGEGTAPVMDAEPERVPWLPVAHRSKIYQGALNLLQLRPEGRDDLLRRGIGQDAILRQGYQSLPRQEELTALVETMQLQYSDETLRACPGFADRSGTIGFWMAGGERDGYVVPYRDECGRITGLQAKVLGGKYLSAAGSNYLQSVYNVAGRPANDLYLTEGGTKGLVASELLGVWTFAVVGQTLTSEHLEVIECLAPQRVWVALDEEENPNTDQARERWLHLLWDAGFHTIGAARWQGAKGLDDLAAQGGRPHLCTVSYAPTPFVPAARRRIVMADIIDTARLGFRFSQP